MRILESTALNWNYKFGLQIIQKAEGLMRGRQTKKPSFKRDDF
jgi:hypothetical protein